MDNLRENIYGHKKRFEHILQEIEKYRIQQGISKNELEILDVGCGTGVMLTFPLGHAGFHVTGLDIDSKSIQAAQSLSPPENVKFICGTLEDLKQRFHVIVCSEVLEHINDPENFLRKVAQHLRSDGILILTVPNGYGAFEIEKFIYEKLGGKPAINITEKIIYRIRRMLIRTGLYQPPPSLPCPSTLNKSPHVQRFTLKKLVSLAEKCGLRAINIRGSTVVGGAVTHFLIGWSEFFVKMNAVLGDRVPLPAASGWYVTLKKIEKTGP